MELRRVTLVFPILAILLILSLFGCGETSAPTELTTKTEKTIEDALQAALGSQMTLEPHIPAIRLTSTPWVSACKPTGERTEIQMNPMKTPRVSAPKPTNEKTLRQVNPKPNLSDGHPVFLSKWGTHGKGDGQFNSPHDVAVALDASVYIFERNNHRIQKFTSAGVFVSKWGTEGSEGGEFYFPEGVAVGPGGSVYVAEESNDRI